MRITKERLKEIIIEEISEHQFGFPSLGLTLADVTPTTDEPEDKDGTEEVDEEEPINPDIAAYRKKYGGGKFISTPRSNQGSDIKKRPRRYQEDNMKITKEQLQQIIKEELEAVLFESKIGLPSAVQKQAMDDYDNGLNAQSEDPEYKAAYEKYKKHMEDPNTDLEIDDSPVTKNMTEV